MKPWTGKTKGSLMGYRFFIYTIDYLGVKFAYFCCHFVSFYFLVFAKNQRKGLQDFYSNGLNYSKIRTLSICRRTFYNFGQSLIDRLALMTSRKDAYTYDFENEKVLKEMAARAKGGVLISAHLGNWEVAGNLLHDRVTTKINVLALDNEVKAIKELLALKSGKSRYNLIPIKDNFSHLILIKQALDRNELIAIHADRTLSEGKNIILPFLNKEANFPLGPFIIAHKFKVPVTFVFALKNGNQHYSLSATQPIYESNCAEDLAREYVKCLEEKIKNNPDQWYNFYDFYAH
jgi:predicted LPLAT superfamily acyltransferase